MTGTDMEEHAVSHEQAATLHQTGRIAEAAAMYQVLLERHPQDAELLTLFGMTQFQLGREEEAQGIWRRGVALEAPAEVRLRIIANIMAVSKGKAEALDLVADLDIPQWPPSIVPNPSERRMIIALARGLVSRKRIAAALTLLDSVLPQLMADANFVMSAIAVMLEAGQAAKALAILRPLTSKAAPIDSGLIIAHAAAAYQAGHEKEAWHLTRRAAEAVPIHLTAKEPGQLMLIGVLSRTPLFIESILTPAEMHFSGNTPASLALKHNDEYRFLSIFPEAQSALTALANAPRPELILNNWVNGELLETPRALQFIADFADQLGLPILNHPRKAAETTRQKNAGRLAGIPNLIVPRLIRFDHQSKVREQSVRLVGEATGFPAIIRGPFNQRGTGAEKINSPEDLDRHLAALPDMQLYAIEYVDNPATQGVYRKIRAAVIGDELFITHVHFGPRWNVHRERDSEKLKAFDLDGKFAAQAARIIAAPEEALGRPAMAALHEIRRRIPLDLYGIDFDMMPDGRVLFFEANAVMNVSLSDRPGLEDTRAAMRDAVRRLFLKTAGIKTH
jgi:thioredoxin-like negative regulator of GroEL/glutathione synthase/RimK-type ligase-like ATP-grasp enzyme